MRARACAALVLSIAFLTSHLFAADPAKQVQVLKVRVESHTGPGDKAMQKIVVDWKNTSDEPIRTVKATMKAFDEKGNQVGQTVQDYPIYATFAESPGVKPGEEYKKHQGHIIPTTTAKTAEAVITFVSDEGL